MITTALPFTPTPLLDRIKSFDGHMVVASRTGSGKTTILLAAIAYLTKESNGAIEWLIASAKASVWMGLEDQQGKDGQSRVLKASITKPKTIESVLKRLRWAIALQEKREQIRIEKTKRGQKVNPRPVFLILDEWPSLLKAAENHSKQAYKELISLVEAIVFIGRQDKIFIWLAAQGHQCKTLHISGDLRANLGVVALGGAGNYQSVTSAISDADLIEMQSDRDTLKLQYKALVEEDPSGRIYYTSIGGHQLARSGDLPDMEQQQLFEQSDCAKPQPEPKPEVKTETVTREQLERVYERSPDSEQDLKDYVDRQMAQQERILTKQIEVQKHSVQVEAKRVEVEAFKDSAKAEDRWNLFTLLFGVGVGLIYAVPPFSGALQATWKASVGAAQVVAEATEGTMDMIAPDLSQSVKQGEEINGAKVTQVGSDRATLSVKQSTALYLVGKQGTSTSVTCKDGSLSYQLGNLTYTYSKVAQCAGGSQQVGAIVGRTAGNSVVISRSTHAPTKADVWQILTGNEPDPVMQRSGNPSEKGEKIAQAAIGWVGKDFAPGQSEQCANFVREALKTAGIEVGVSQKPVDGLDTNSALANSFFGEDIGQVIKDKGQLQPGDLVAYGGTYGGYPASTITHVAIYIGNGEIVDRPTASKPVQRRSIDTFEHFVAGVRVK